MAHILWLIVWIALDVVALVLCWRSGSRGTATKLLWTLVIVFVPILGAVALLLVDSISAFTRAATKSAHR